MKPLTINQLDAINQFNLSLRRLTSECGVEEVARKTNLYLKTLPAKYGLWELDLIKTPSQIGGKKYESC